MRRTYYDILGLGLNDNKDYLIRYKFNAAKQILDQQYDEDSIPPHDYAEKIKEIDEAYETLIDPKLRENYRNKILLEKTLEKMGFSSELIDLNISGQDAVDKIAKGKEGDFLIRKSGQEGNREIVFTVKNNDQVSHLRIPYNIENGEVKFNEKQQHVFDFYLAKLLLKSALEKLGFPSELIDLNISGQNAVNSVEEGKFLIRKSQTNNNEIVFTVKNNDQVSHLRIPYKIENGELTFDADKKHIIDFYKEKANAQTETQAFRQGKS